MLLGLIQILSGEEELAETTFRRVIRRAPLEERELCAREAALFFESQWELKRAVSMLELVGDEFTRARQSAYLLARIGQGDAAAYEGAVPHARRAVSLEPEDADSYAVLAMALAGAREEDAARAAIGRALALGRENHATCFLVAWAFYTLGDMNEADHWDRESIRLSSSWTPSLINLAMSCSLRGEYAEAIELIDRGITLVPADFYAYLQRGIVRRLQGEYLLALADLEEAERLLPTFAWTAVERGKLAEAMGEIDGAEGSYREALVDARGDAWTEAQAFRGLGHIYVRRGVRDVAIRYLTEALQRDPADEATREEVAGLRNDILRDQPPGDGGKD
jgi:tetratricopeptide (TPR) repeat protein